MTVVTRMHFQVASSSLVHALVKTLRVNALNRRRRIGDVASATRREIGLKFPRGGGARFIRDDRCLFVLDGTRAVQRSLADLSRSSAADRPLKVISSSLGGFLPMIISPIDGIIKRSFPREIIFPRRFHEDSDSRSLAGYTDS